MSEFTKGPWHAEQRDDIDSDIWPFTVHSDDWVLAKVYGDVEALPYEANARLIAAAPELYWALLKLARAADACDPRYEDIPGDVQARVNEANEILAKARGNQ